MTALTGFHPDRGCDSLAPPQRGEGWGEGCLRTATIGLLTPALSSFKGGEGARLVQRIVPAWNGRGSRPAGEEPALARRTTIGPVAK